jgi:hypothetical protein
MTPGDAEEQPVAQTTVLHAPGDEASAARVARHVTGGAITGSAEFLEPGRVVLITGTDFTTLHEQPAPADADAGSTNGEAPPTTVTAPSTSTTAPGVAVGSPPSGQQC